jgi:hypothetical protein
MPTTQEVLQIYRSANGRSRIENQIVGQAPAVLANKFRNLMDLLKHWRDEASHGGISDISEFEANEALAGLLRLAHFVDDHLGRANSRTKLARAGWEITE